jgi:hypothetical protein
MPYKLKRPDRLLMKVMRSPAIWGERCRRAERNDSILGCIRTILSSIILS